jgi:tetratricopeptide (TPR) repeat protein
VYRFSGNITSALILLLLITVLHSGCASKKHARRAVRLEEAGLYEMAAGYYLRSYHANPNNLEAITGLRRTAQRTIDNKNAVVSRACLSGNDRETVYRYLETMEFYQKIRNTGISLSMHEEARRCYEEAKTRFLDASFDEARLLLEEEDFIRAQSIFAEIKRIDPNYRDLGQYMKVSQSEPLYRQGIAYLNNGLYRSAYNTFTHLITSHGVYKDAGVLRQDALAAGMMTISIADFENRTRQRNAHEVLKSMIIAEIGRLNNPFLQVVDDRNTNTFVREQERAARMGSEMKIGRLMSSKALLTGSFQSFEVQEGGLQRFERRGYLREVIEEKTGESDKSVRTVYHKVTWHEFRRENYAAGSFRYQLSSTETGAVLASGVIQLKPADQIHYAVFEGDHNNLVPGYWEYQNRQSAKDNIQDQRTAVREIQNLLKARAAIKSTADLQKELFEGIASEVSRAINSYNPEK